MSSYLSWIARLFARAHKSSSRSFSVGNVVKYSLFSLSSEADAQDVERFFADKDTSAFVQPLSQGLDSVRSKAKWLERDAQDVEQWLRDNKYLQ